MALGELVDNQTGKLSKQSHLLHWYCVKTSTVPSAPRCQQLSIPAELWPVVSGGKGHAPARPGLAMARFHPQVTEQPDLVV